MQLHSFSRTFREFLVHVLVYDGLGIVTIEMDELLSQFP